MKKVQCTQCLGSKQYMVPKKTTGFEYKDCTLCDENGEISPDVAEDFNLSLDENTIDYYE